MALGFVGLAAAVVMKYTTGPGMTANPLFLFGAMLELMGVQFLSLGLMGEVLARIYFESQGKPPYVVRETRNIEPAAAARADRGVTPPSRSCVPIARRLGTRVAAQSAAWRARAGLKTPGLIRGATDWRSPRSGAARPAFPSGAWEREDKVTPARTPFGRRPPAGTPR